ncbi:MAG: TetR/AcrR family transcriptional regulator [Thermoleophilaceae bacterium]
MAPTQQERSEVTRAKLVEAARELFAQDGYAATFLDGVVARAGVTKGALYHQFDDKRDLFKAVYEEEQRRLAEQVTNAAAARRDPWDAFAHGCRAFFEASLDPGVQRITLLDAPSVLGWEQMRAIEARHSGALLHAGIQNAIDAQRIAKRPVAPLAHMLLGAMCEAAMMVARAENQRRATSEVLEELNGQLDALAL